MCVCVFGGGGGLVVAILEINILQIVLSGNISCAEIPSK